MRELAQMGLLPDAMAVLEQELGLVRKSGSIVSDQDMRMLEVKILMLKEGLVQAVSRSQLYHETVDEAKDTPSSAGPLAQQSVSQLGQDLWVLEKSAFKRGGYFVEFGATDGILLSNTYLLEKQFGWTGLCAEPNPDYFAELQKNRTCTVSDVCIGAQTGQEVDFILADEFGTMVQYAGTDTHAKRREAFQNTGRVLRLRTTSLADFLALHNAPREIDYLSIDTEGSEFDILEAFPFDRWKIRLISAEHNFTEMRSKIADLLGSHGYARTEAKWDDWYELIA